MAEPVETADGAKATRLFFGTAIVRKRMAGRGRAFWAVVFWAAVFWPMLPFHRLYSRLLLASAIRRL